MKIRLLSDLHLEFSGFEYTYQGEDVLVLAGDIIDGNNVHRLNYWLETVPETVSVVYVPGNHEFYHTSIEAGLERLAELAQQRDSFCLLQNDWNYKIYDDVVYYFFGGTQFSYIHDDLADLRDFRLLGDFKYTHNHSIKKHNEQFNLFNEAYDDFIKLHKKQSCKTIGISHFLPSASCIQSKYEGNSLNTYFYADNDERVKQADLWLFGHCIDSESEILTDRGWLNHSSITKQDIIYNYNIESERFEKDNVEDIIKWDEYCGLKYSLKSKTLDFVVSEKHNIIAKSSTDKLIYEPMDKFCVRDSVKFIISGEFDNPGLNLPTRMAELYIAIAADGSINHDTELVRFRLLKDRKKKYISELLNYLNIPFTRYDYDKGDSCINFKLPKELTGLSIKGLDHKLMSANVRDCEEILRAYMNTDGGVYSKQIAIYSSKKEEIDLLQAMFTINGFKASFSSKKSGFCDNPGYTLFVRKKQTTLLQRKYTNNDYIVEESKSELFWCIRTKNGNFFMRRNGKVMLTGNTHSSVDIVIDKTRVICNPRGYSSYYNLHPENPDFNPNLIIEI